MDDITFREWARQNRRELVVRCVDEPWAILVLEVMSQQTRIDRVDVALGPFLRRWPEPAALARAGTRELLEGWAGLGYNRRALALREAARVIVAEHDGIVPSDVASLEGLPGIGPYTARAIAATAFAVPVAPLDVNIRRVLERVAGGERSVRELQAFGDELVWADDPRGWVEAVMDLAVAVCHPRAPLCDACPLATGCATRNDVAGVVRGRAVSPAPRGEPFRSTRRWLRGEIVRRLRAAPEASWLALDGPIGEHGPAAVREALEGLERDGFLERRPGAEDDARIPLE